ncbi:MAG: threonine synthase [Pseudomonadota bacterium]
MKYVSTRGTAPELEFEDVLLAGLAEDGGLYVPENWPKLSQDTIKAFASKPYTEVAFDIMVPFIGSDLDEATFREVIEEAYASFEHPAVAPLKQLDTNQWILELFHGPTLAFKDFAMQVLARLMDIALQKRNQRATVIGATSGDTGGAAIEAFRGREAIDIFILHPDGRVSDVQRKQMTTATEKNVHNIALQGTFDDCQALVKALFNDLEFRQQVSLAGVNSINWGRIMAQIVYYFTSAVALGAPHRRVSYSVPTGNFGDIFAGFVARKMGLPINKLIIATNVNDILARTLETGHYQPQGVVATQSPSMDIQVSSNFERLLFELSNREAPRVCALMDSLKENRAFSLNESELGQFRQGFSAERVLENAMKNTIGEVYKTAEYILDPHTAIGFAIANNDEQHNNDIPMITLATAHPAKFPQTVKDVIGQDPPRPKQLSARFDAQERYDVLPNDFAIIKAHLLEHSAVNKQI